MILTTTGSVDGRRIADHLGIVSGHAVMGTNFVRDIFAGIRDVIGGRVGSYEEELRNAKAHALAAIEEEATALGADAVVGMSLDYETLSHGEHGTLLMVCVSGTAVRLAP